MKDCYTGKAAHRKPELKALHVDPTRRVTLTQKAVEPIHRSSDGPCSELWIHRLGHVQQHGFTPARK